LLARHQHTCDILARELDPGALARLWTARLWLEADTDWLAIVGLGVVVAVAIVERDIVLVARLAMPQIQEAVCGVVTVWFVVAPAAKPPWGAIGGRPCLLVLVLRVHWVTSAATAATGRTGNVDDPVRRPYRICRCKKCLPITAGGWRPDLGALWAAVLVQRSANIDAVCALDKGTRRIMSLQGHAHALGTTGAAAAWFCWHCLHAGARGRLQALCHGWERKEFTPLVIPSRREKVWNKTLLQRWNLWVFEVQEFGVDGHLLTSVNFGIGHLAIGEGLDEAFHPLQATPFGLSVCLFGDGLLLKQLVILLLSVVASRISLASVLYHDGMLA